MNSYFLPGFPTFSETLTVFDNENGCETHPCIYLDNRSGSYPLFIKGRVPRTDLPMIGTAHLFVSVDKTYLANKDFLVVTVNDNPRLGVDKGYSLTDVPISIGKNGDFEFTVNILLKDEFPRSEASKMRLIIKHRLDIDRPFLSKEGDWMADELDVTFFFRESLNESWIGMDPGTTGSCMMIGSSTSQNARIDAPDLKIIGSTITPSMVIIPRTTRYKGFGAEKFKEYEPGEDYYYGAEARQNWISELKSGSRGFISIKKLLGLNAGAIEVPMNGGVAEFKGSDIAHLLFKGLDRDLQKSLENFTIEERNTFIPNGFPQRMVVAIPNNYTLPKIRDMVKSIQDLGRYAEIRYIYEPEAVMFNYLMKEYAKLADYVNETILVFDMGGATINASLYSYSIDKNDFIKVTTVGKIGYAVGGDTIDFALIESLIDLYKKKKISEENRLAFERKYKDKLLPRIFDFKLSLIKAKSGVYEGIFSSSENFVNFMNTTLEGLKDYGLEGIDEDWIKMCLEVTSIWEKYRINVVDYFLSSKQLKQYVYDRVIEATKDVMAFKNKGVDRVIFSGRSVLFPGIKDCVLKTLGVDGTVEWKGLDNDEIKTAVARGACWYGVYGKRITLDNVIITSSYGYTHTERLEGEMKSMYYPIITSKDVFDKNGEYKNKVTLSDEPDFFNDGSKIKFYQIMGAEVPDMFDKSKKYKRSYLGSIKAVTNVQAVAMSINCNDKTDVLVLFKDHQTRSLKNDLQTGDINEEDEAYAFAILQPEVEKADLKTDDEPNDSIEASNTQSTDNNKRKRI